MRFDSTVGPPSRQWMMWWIWHQSNATSQPGWAHVGYIARNARRCAGVATRWLAALVSTVPSGLRTSTSSWASQRIRSSVVSGTGSPCSVSQIVAR